MFLLGVGVGVIVGLLVASWCAVLLVALDPRFGRRASPEAPKAETHRGLWARAA